MSAPRLRRIVLSIVTVAVVAVCVRLGFWQLDRLADRRAGNVAIEAGMAQPPTPLARLLEEHGSPDDLAYRRVTATGTYDPANELVLYGRALDGSPGDHVLTPLVLDEGPVVLVDRGWIPYEPQRDTPIAPPADAPTGPVTVDGVLLPSEPGAAFAGGPGGETLVRSVRVSEIDERMTDHELTPGYLLLGSQTPPQPEGLPVPTSVPQPTEGPHLSYAIQWFSFATIAIVGYVVLLRKDRRDDRAGGDVAEEG